MRSTRLAGPVLLLALLAAGCSEDGDSAQPDPSPTAESPTTESGSGLGGESLQETPSTQTTPTPDADVGEPPTTYDEGAAHVAAASGEPVELARFLTPSGNIYCSISDLTGTPACELGEGPVKDLDVCDPQGPSVFVGRIELGEDGPVPLCNTDTIRGAQATPVEYGDVVTWPSSPVECVVEEIGVTCLDDDLREGFFLARGRYRLLG
ncbi:hypothetical protein [Nocardioides sp. 503]|uniref:hypothetical protein n=1 Tax=Nocardioides sp. 503 TaxID=2508326 RepID=UPI00106F5722|nr:hypothetical protein [Nocardioides sp. 503]